MNEHKARPAHIEQISRALGRLTATSFENYSAIFESRVEAWNATAEGFADFVQVLDP